MAGTGMDGFKAHYGKIDAGGLDLSEVARQLQSILDTMDQDLQPLRAGWSGEAQQSYLRAKEQWSQGMNGLKQVLAEIAALLPEVSGHINRVDVRNAGLFTPSR